MKRLHDALCAVVQRLPAADLARIIERDPRSARRWVQVLVGQKRLADLSVVAVLHLARHETRTYGSTSIADAFRDMTTPEPDASPVHPADLQAFVANKARGDIRESELVLEVQKVLADGRIDPEEAKTLIRVVDLALHEASTEVRQLEDLRRKLQRGPG